MTDKKFRLFNSTIYSRKRKYTNQLNSTKVYFSLQQTTILRLWTT